MTACTHRFLVEPPNGPTSLGVCRECGHERVMYNAFEERLWENTATGERPNFELLKKRQPSKVM